MRIHEIIQESYSRDNIALLKYMKSNDFDQYNYWWDIAQYLVEYDHLDYIEKHINRDDVQQYTDDYGDSGLVHYVNEKVDPQVFDTFPEHFRDEVKEYVIDYRLQHDPAEADTKQFLNLLQDTLLKRSTWLIHFSDNASNIASNGFKYGVNEMDKLGLTTHLGDFYKSYQGFNFAFDAESRHALHGEKYGSSAVMFQNSGVKAWHNGDAEDQVMFYGPDVNPNKIVLLIEQYGDWMVYSEYGGHDNSLYTGTLEDCIDWVIKHHQQYKNVIYSN